MNIRRLVPIPALLLAGLYAAGPVQGQAVDDAAVHPAIPLLDEAGAHVLHSGKPYSPRTSCGTGGCHDYDSITHAYHLEQGRDEVDDQYGVRRGLPRLFSPGYFGGYNCMGGNNQDQVAKKYNASADDFFEYGAPGVLMRCAGCHSGGGWMEKDRHGQRYDQTDPASVTPFDGDYFNRGTDSSNAPADASVVAQWDWRKSGVVENDCFMCHFDYSGFQVFDPALQTEGGPGAVDLWGLLRDDKLIDSGHFRYAATATLEYMNLGYPDTNGAARNLVSIAKQNVNAVSDGHGRTTLSYDLALDTDGNPVLAWNPAAFDAQGKALIPMLSFPANDNCMQCHRTSNSRRGFYGFGEGAEAVYDQDGIVEEDYQDDVHYGKVFTEANGEAREIRTCNACHTRNYFRPGYANVDLDADHNFLKGNSDMDVHNDRDFGPQAKSCLYCHDTGPNPIVPSGHADMLSAHLQLWKSGGDLRGYTANSLGRSPGPIWTWSPARPAISPARSTAGVRCRSCTAIAGKRTASSGWCPTTRVPATTGKTKTAAGY